jgi:hypothetical protein
MMLEGSNEAQVRPGLTNGVAMKLHILWIIGLALFGSGCVEKEQAAPDQGDTTQMTEPAAADSPATIDADFAKDVFMGHMHAHAEQLDNLNLNLADGELEKAKVAAYWIARHETVSGFPDDWREYVVGMQEAARAVEEAPDLVIARTAAERITGQCQGCHAAAGVGNKL